MENKCPRIGTIFWDCHDDPPELVCDEPNQAIPRFLQGSPLYEWPRKLTVYGYQPKARSSEFKVVCTVTIDLVDWIAEHEPEWLEDELVQAWIEKTEDKTGGELK
jgi:hypothetical protein